MNHCSLLQRLPMLGLLLPTLVTSARHGHSGHLDSIARAAWSPSGDGSGEIRGIPYSTRPYDQVLFEQWIGAVGYTGVHLASSRRPPEEDAQGLQEAWHGCQRLMARPTDLALPTGT